MCGHAPAIGSWGVRGRRWPRESAPAAQPGAEDQSADLHRLKRAALLEREHERVVGVRLRGEVVLDELKKVVHPPYRVQQMALALWKSGSGPLAAVGHSARRAPA